MTTFNAATIAKVRFIAECAHEDCALTTLKNAKEQITNRCKIFAGYENQWAGIDRAEVLECFTQAMDCTRKADFTRRIELLLETMRDMEIANERAAARAKTEAAAPAAVEAAPAEDAAHEAVRIANRKGYWITKSQIEAAQADGAETADQIAVVAIGAIQAAERRAQYAAELATAQAEHDAAQLASMAALEVAVMADTTGTLDTPEFAAYEAAEEALTVKTEALLQACGRYSIEMATHAGKPVADIEALKTCFAPYFTGNTANVHPGRVNELVAMAHKIPVSAPQRH